MVDILQLSKNKQLLKGFIFKSTGIDIDNDPLQTHFFTKEYNRIFENLEYEKYRDRLLYFLYFLSQLAKIKNKKTKDFNYYINRLKDDNNFTGEKFEILTYARLIDKKIFFKKPSKNPDFEIDINNQKIYIECGTRHSKKRGYYKESIKQVIDNKQKAGLQQKYANKNTALHIDISKSIYNSYEGDDNLDYNSLNSILDEKIIEVDYGAIVLINSFYAAENGIVYSTPLIRYANNYNPNLSLLHKEIFPLQNMHVTPILRSFI